MSSSSESPLATMRAAPPFTDINWMFWRPRSVVVKKRLLESGDQEKLLTAFGRLSVRLPRRPSERSITIRRQRSLSYPARVCARQPSHLPSGEYLGERSAPGVEVIF